MLRKETKKKKFNRFGVSLGLGDLDLKGVAEGISEKSGKARWESGAGTTDKITTLALQTSKARVQRRPRHCG